MDVHRTLIIAEMAWAHDGSLEKALNILRAAREAGADALSVHLTSMPDYMVPHYGSGVGRVSAGKEHMKIYEYLQNINLSPEDWRLLAEEARAIEMPLCVMPNDAASLDFSEREIRPAYYVLTAASFIEKDFIVAIAKTKKPTFFRIGGATLEEIDSTLKLFQSYSEATVTLLHGFQNYPTSIEETQLMHLSALRDRFKVPVGLADHLDGSDPFAKILPLMALPLGVRCIEKHITWDRNERGEDFEAALNPSDFSDCVRWIRLGEAALGNQALGFLSEAAQRYRSVARKRVVAKRPIHEHEVFSEENITLKRSDEGLGASDLNQLIGKKSRRTLLENEGIVLEDLLCE